MLLLIWTGAGSSPLSPLPPVPCPAVPCTMSCWSLVCVLALQLVSDTRRVSDIQWFREAYGAVTQTVRVVATEQSRQQRGWVFTPGELLTTSAPRLGTHASRPTCRPGHPLLGSPSGLPLSPWQAVGSEQGIIKRSLRPGAQEHLQIKKWIWVEDGILGDEGCPVTLAWYPYLGCLLQASGLLEVWLGPIPLVLHLCFPAWWGD